MMKGEFDVEIRSKIISYKFTVKRKITILKGDSGTGKTTMVNMLRERIRRNSGIQVNCKVSCVVSADGVNWVKALSIYSGCIIFLDEDDYFIYSKDFASFLKRSDNYFVIITRRELKELSYSVSEIYQLRVSGKFNFFEPLYDLDILSGFTPETLLVEDSGSGYSFFSFICDIDKDSCVSAYGNSNVLSTLGKLIKDDRNNILIIIDGAAFGAFIDDVFRRISSFADKVVAVYMPESFEYMLLLSGMFSRKKDVMEFVLKVVDHCDTSFVSYEDYFRKLLVSVTKDTSANYSKSKLNKCYMLDCCCKKEPCGFRVRGNKLEVLLYDLLKDTDLSRVSTRLG